MKSDGVKDCVDYPGVQVCYVSTGGIEPIALVQPFMLISVSFTSIESLQPLSSLRVSIAVSQEQHTPNNPAARVDMPLGDTLGDLCRHMTLPTHKSKYCSRNQ